jgi:hypothetical protein
MSWKVHPMLRRAKCMILVVRCIVVMTLAVLVHWGYPGHPGSLVVGAAHAQARKAQPKPPAAAPPAAAVGAEALPGGVIEMRDAILVAVRSGNIEDLKTALAWNELPPVISGTKVDDPIAYWKSISGDGRGLEILATIDAVFAAGHAVLPFGRDVENNKLYVWPRFAEMDLTKLKPEDEVQLYRLATPAAVKEMIAKKRWLGYRLAIGADGTWHSFQKAE